MLRNTIKIKDVRCYDMMGSTIVIEWVDDENHTEGTYTLRENGVCHWYGSSTKIKDKQTSRGLLKRILEAFADLVEVT